MFGGLLMDSTLEQRGDRRRKSRKTADPQSEHGKFAKWKVDPDHLLGIVGIVGTILNLLVVVLVYIYTPV